MSKLLDLLDEIETALDTITEFKTLKLSTEMGISAKECPACRIVPINRQVSSVKYNDSGEIQIVVLLDLKNNVSEMQRQSILFEEAIREVLNPIIKYTYTEYDRDGISNFKAVILSYSFDGLRNSQVECPNELA